MAVRIMGEKQLNTKLTDDEVKYIVSVLKFPDWRDEIVCSARTSAFYSVARLLQSD